MFVKASMSVTPCSIKHALVYYIDSTGLQFYGQVTKSLLPVLLLTNNYEKPLILNQQCLKYAVWCIYIVYMVYVSYIYIYNQSICRQQLFHSLRPDQYSSDQKKILKDQSAQTAARVVSVAYHLWLPFLINRVLNLIKLRSVIFSQSADSSYFALWELISTAQIKRRS